jgi:cap1 methyltransferase
MSYSELIFTIPNNIEKRILSPIPICNDEVIILYNDLYLKLKEVKEQIDTVQLKQWDKAKKIANPYELLNLSTNKYRDSIAKYRPISRSYFKLLEMISTFNLLPNKNITCVCLAEGPGGFIESLLLNRENNDSIHGVTLFNYNKNIPSWYKLTELINQQLSDSNVTLEYSSLYNITTITGLDEVYKDNKADFVTSDGGFDYSNNFNSQEQMSYQILYCEVITALCIQKRGGNYICKYFDLLTSFSINIIYILYCFYDEVHIYKPLTSRPANSEKYIICKNYKGGFDNIKGEYLNIINNWNDNIIDIYNIDDVPRQFYDAMYNLNTEYISRQISYINKTMGYINVKIENNIYNAIINNQVNKAIWWCNKYNIDINQTSKYITNLSD